MREAIATAKYKGVKLYKEIASIVLAAIKLLAVLAPISVSFQLGVPSLTVEEYLSLLLLVAGVVLGYHFLKR